MVISHSYVSLPEGISIVHDLLMSERCVDSILSMPSHGGDGVLDTSGHGLQVPVALQSEPRLSGANV